MVGVSSVRTGRDGCSSVTTLKGIDSEVHTPPPHRHMYTQALRSHAADQQQHQKGGGGGDGAANVAGDAPHPPPTYRYWLECLSTAPHLQVHTVSHGALSGSPLAMDWLEGGRHAVKVRRLQPHHH